jgi:adenine phosphoribosyltransferase
MKVKYLHLIDTNTNGHRYDITPLFADYDAFSALVDDILTAFSPNDFDYIAGIDALGFILGTAVSIRAAKGFIPIRKGGKLPVATRSVSFVNYLGVQKSLEIRVDAALLGEKVLIVDEWIETGTQVHAAVELIESQQGTIAGIATIKMDENESTQILKKKYKCYQVPRKE